MEGLDCLISVELTRDEAYEMLERVDVHTMQIDGHATGEGWRALTAELVPELVPPGRAAESAASS